MLHGRGNGRHCCDRGSTRAEAMLLTRVNIRYKLVKACYEYPSDNSVPNGRNRDGPKILW